MRRMHSVLTQNLEASHIEQVFRETFRQLVQEIDKFYSAINTESKFAKKRVRVDII